MSALLWLFPLEMRDHRGRRTADSREFLLEFEKKKITEKHKGSQKIKVQCGLKEFCWLPVGGTW